MGKDKKDKKQKKQAVEEESEEEVVTPKKSKKEKKQKKPADEDEDVELTDAPQENSSALTDLPPPDYATPLASSDLVSQLLKLVTKGKSTCTRCLHWWCLARDLEKSKKVKQGLIRGVKWTTKAIKKNVKGVCLIAADAVPVDIWAHLPVYCEETKTPYIFVPSTNTFRQALMKPQVCVYVTQNAQDSEFKSLYDKVMKQVEAQQK